AARRSGPMIEPHQIAVAALAALAREPDVLEHRQPEEQVGDLERAGNAEPRQLVRGPTGDVPPIELDRSRIGAQRAGDQVEGGALARAVRADDRGDRPRRRLEAQLIHGAQRAESLVELADLDHDQAFRATDRAKPRCSRPHTPSGRNITNTMKMAP